MQNKFRVLFSLQINNVVIYQLYFFYSMNRDYAKDLRSCQKTQSSQTFLHMDMFQKKIRKKPQYGLEQINSQMKMRQINSFWKQNWHYEHFHPIFINPISISPTIIIEDSKDSQNQDKYTAILNNYNEAIYTLFKRLKAESDDQNSYKINSMPYKSVQQCCSTKQYQRFESIIQQSLRSCLQFVENMKKQIQSLAIDQSGDCMHDYVQVLQPVIQFCFLNLSKMVQPLIKYQIAEEVVQSSCFKQLMRFCIQFRQCIDNTIQSDTKNSSILFSAQPQIKSFTYLIHPVIQAAQLYLRQKKLMISQIKQKIKNRRYTNEDCLDQQIPQQFIGQSDQSKQIMIERYYRSLHAKVEAQSPRILIINLDGYQSQFNIQYARKLNQDLMYVSFPKENRRSLQYSKRFYKKIMPTYTRQAYQQIQQELLAEKERITNNPENYHEYLQQFLMDNNPHYKCDQMNQNVFLFPINSQAMREKWSQLKIGQQNVQLFESHLIRTIFRNYVASEIKKFSPSVTIISFTGRLALNEKHLVEILQQITKLSNMKLIFFPNLTTLFCPQIEQQLKQSRRSEHQIDYEYIQDSRVDFQKKQFQFQMCEQQNQKTISIEFLGTLTKFLKISSGTYNLNFNLQQQPLPDKYNNSKAFQYTSALFQVLSKQNPRIRQIKPHGHINFQYQFYKQRMQDELIQKGVSFYYKNLYKIYEHLVFQQQNSSDFLKNQRINPEQYFSLIRQIKQINRNSQISISSIDFQKQGKSRFEEHKRLKFLQLASRKYQEKLNIYIKNMTENLYFELQSRDKEDRMDCLAGIYFLTFFNQNRQNIRIDQNTNILYNENQLKSEYFHIFLMNNDSFEQKTLKNYVALAKQNALHYKFQRCQTQEVRFIDEYGQTIQNKPYKINTNWNYAQTADYLILFWPSQFDFIREIGQTTMGRKYEPKIKNQIFVAKKMKKQAIQQIVFKKINYLTQIQVQLQPRCGVSVYPFLNKLFLFGGFYGKENNYLNLQHDLTTFDLNNFQFDANPKIIIENEKMAIYCQNKIKVQSDKSGQNKVNSFVRARTGYQFYNKAELFGKIEKKPNEVEQQNTIIMMGGYGQNFVRPFSLLTNHYYQLKFDVQNRRIASIHKKWIYNRALPINIRGLMKNKNLCKKMNLFDEGDQLIKIGYATPSHYLFHRIAYQFDKQDNLDYRIKTFYAIQQYSTSKSNFVQLAKKLGELRPIHQQDEISLIEINHTKNYIVLSQGERKFVVGIYFQIGQGNGMTQVKLTNNSLISIDINSNKIFALIKHGCYTQDQSVLAACDIVFPKYQITQDEIYNISDRVLPIVLKPVKYFSKDLTMHTIIACSKKLVLILHGGVLIQNCYKIEEYTVKLKYLPQKQTHQVSSISKIDPYCFPFASKYSFDSFFIKKDMRVQCYNLFYGQKHGQIVQMTCQIMNIGQIKQSWHIQQNYQLSFAFFVKQKETEVIIRNPNIIEIRKSLKDDLLFRIRYKQVQLTCNFSYQLKSMLKQQKFVKIQLKKQFNARQWQQSNRGKAIHKSKQQYEDID